MRAWNICRSCDGTRVDKLLTGKLVTHHRNLLLSIRGECLLVKDRQVNFFLFRFSSFDLSLSHLELRTEIIWHILVTVECPSVDAVPFSSGEQVPEII
jgi:hypothetical protein